MNFASFRYIFLAIFVFHSFNIYAQKPGQLRYDNDQGDGISTSLFGTYIQKGELLLYPYFEYSMDHNREYQPSQYGFGPEQDFLAKYKSREGGLFFGYGVTDKLAIEFEASYMKATFEKDPRDLFATPNRIIEKGLGDIESQIRWLWMRPHGGWPEIQGFLEITIPSQKHKLFIGDKDWDFRPGVVLSKNYTWGKMSFRTDLEYNRESSGIDIGETAIEYLKRLSSPLRLVLAIEGGEGGAPDEWSFISGIRWQISNSVSLKFDNSLGITSKASDWAPQVGLVFSRSFCKRNN
jgi:hypothetical protein